MPVDYSPTQYMHPHDIVFQQMLRSSQLPTPAFTFRADLMTRPMAPEPYTRRERRQMASEVRSEYSTGSDSDVDDGYHADKDNGPRKLLKGEPQCIMPCTIE